MNALQPNFEKIKTALYQTIIGSTNGGLGNKVDYYVLFEQAVVGKMLPSFRKRKMDFQADLNEWLNGVDIRCSGQLINAVKELGGKLPKWMEDKKFIIDYNRHGFLDLAKASFVTQSF